MITVSRSKDCVHVAHLHGDKLSIKSDPKSNRGYSFFYFNVVLPLILLLFHNSYQNFPRHIQERSVYFVSIIMIISIVSGSCFTSIFSES